MTLTRRKTMALGLGGLLVLPAAARGQLVHGPDPVALTHDPDQPVLGNPEGDVTIVEFFDYQCPFCRQGHAALLRMVGADGGLRLVMKDWPVFGPLSLRAAQVALGAVGMGRYAAVMDSLMALRGGRLTEAAIDTAARDAGVDPAAALDAHAQEADRWTGLLRRNGEQADMLGLMGTPSYVVGQDVFAGVTSVMALQRAVDALRRG